MLLLRPGYSPITRGSLARNELNLSILRLLINPNSGNKTHRVTGLHFRLTRAAFTNHSSLTYIKCSLYSPIFPTFHPMDGFRILHVANSQKSNPILNIPIRRISVEAKARARDSKYEDGNEGGGGLSGRGKGERRKGQDRIDALGRLMTKILRHEADKLKLSMRGDGYVLVNKLLKLKVKTFTGLPLCSHNVADVKEAVKNDNKQRLSLLEENGQLLIRANQGHSIKVVDSEKLLKPILSADEVPVCVHGTYRRNLESIQRTGLKRMTRVHIHFATGLPHDGVISGPLIAEGFSMEFEMSQSPLTDLEIDDEDGFFASKEASPIPQRKLKRLKRAGHAPGNERRQVPLSDQNKIADESDPMDYMNANEFGSNGQGFTTSLEQIQDAEEQCIVQNSFCNLLDEVDKEDDPKEDHQADNVYSETEMLETISTFMYNTAPEKGKNNENLKVPACTNEHIMEATEKNKVANSYTEIESLKGKNKSRKSTHEKDKHNKKLKKNPVSTDEFMVGASNDLHKVASRSLEKEEEEEKKKKKKKKKGSQDKSKPSPKSLDTEEKKRDKKKKKSDLEEIHAESQRLLRETPNASFKPQQTVGKSISSVLEKIRLRKLQLEQKAGKGSSGVLESSEDDTSSEDLLEESHHTSLSDGDENKDEPLKEMPQMENEEGISEEVSFRNSIANESGILQTPDNHSETSLCEKGTRQDNAKTNGVFRAPVEDTQDLFCNSQLSSGEDQEENPDDSTQEDEILVPTLSNMNLKLDSHPDDDELFDEDEDKENVDPSSSKPVETSVYSKGASVKAFVDDEAEDEDEDILVRHDEDDNSEEDDNEDLKDLVATAEEEQPADQWRRDELHRKWLEEQDSAETGDILLRLGCGWRQKGARKPALLSEDDDVAFDHGEDHIVECDDNLLHDSLVSQESDHGDDDSDMEAQLLKPVVDEDDVYESSDDEELEERLMRQRVLEESEEQEIFLSPADDETSREVFGLIKKVNVAPTVKKKPKPSSAFHEIIGSGGNSNSSSKSSFLGRTTNSSLQTSHKQGMGSSRFYIFGRDDSNSSHAVSKAESQEDMDQKENKHPADHLNKISSTKNKAKQNEPGNKTANNKTDSSMGPSLFQILRRQTSEVDRTLQSRNANGDEENKQAYSISHFAAFKSFRSVKNLKRTG